ncbi:MAG: vitamin K epoxide reductase family protein [Candidatus Poseidoniaceae archaeon]|nr:vitamin K epoxide reductase family protein [Candidatus Poseidoniaceae archaeon]
MDPNVQLMIYVIPLLIGFLMVLPIGRTIFASFSGSIPTMGSERGRVFIGLIITCLAGMAVSFQTLWISSKISEGGNFCASNSILSCDDVIGNPEYNTDPFFGIPWGGIGAVVFSILLYLTYSSSKEPNADWASSYLKYGTYLTFAGFFVIAMLVYYEFEMGKICQYCTTAHFANIAAFIGFFRLMRLNESKEWNTY